MSSIRDFFHETFSLCMQYSGNSCTVEGLDLFAVPTQMAKTQFERRLRFFFLGKKGEMTTML